MMGFSHLLLSSQSPVPRIWFLPGVFPDINNHQEGCTSHGGQQGYNTHENGREGVSGGLRGNSYIELRTGASFQAIDVENKVLRGSETF